MKAETSAAFKATSITFPAGCSKVTIEGDPLVGIEAINNLSSSKHEFKTAVSGDVVAISNTTAYCVFTGGLTANGGVFCFAGTHLDLNAGPRLAGMRLILSSLVEKYGALSVPVVLVGDMNASETESSMLAATALMQDSLLVSKTTPTGSWRTFNAFSWKSDEVSNSDALANYTAAERTAASSTIGSRIDYIFASRGIDVESFATRNDARRWRTARS